eukprot:4794894-Ditylum_brightwellii.AAC.1
MLLYGETCRSGVTLPVVSWSLTWFGGRSSSFVMLGAPAEVNIHISRKYVLFLSSRRPPVVRTRPPHNLISCLIRCMSWVAVVWKTIAL